MSNTTSVDTPGGGGGSNAISEAFSPDLFSGSGSYQFPFKFPKGRNGLIPKISLNYNTGFGNSNFGFGWNVGVANVSRKTAKGVPTYDDTKDVFLIAGKEDLIPVEKMGDTIRYQPRTVSDFSKIYFVKNNQDAYWKVMKKDGMVYYYGTPGMRGNDEATLTTPQDKNKIASWFLSKVEDPFGNAIRYTYENETSTIQGRSYTQILLKKIEYLNYQSQGQERFGISIHFEFEDRPDPYSRFSNGFEVRSTKRTKKITFYNQLVLNTSTPIYDHTTRSHEYDFEYLDEQNLIPTPYNNCSFLHKIYQKFYRDGIEESLPPTQFNYTLFQPEKRNFTPLKNPDLPLGTLARKDLALIDLTGNGLPDILELNQHSQRYWKNIGHGKFAKSKRIDHGPAGWSLADPNVRIIDYDGDARADLMIHSSRVSGVFPASFNTIWDEKSFQKFQFAPSFKLNDPEVRFTDLTGNGVTDAIRSGSRFELFYQKENKGWDEIQRIERKQLSQFPNVNFSDHRVRLTSLSGNKLKDISLIENGQISYWVNMGHGKFTKKIEMQNAPRFPQGFNHQRIIIGDIDGDGFADLLYIDQNKIHIWINQSGNRWSDPITIHGTPNLLQDEVAQLSDIKGNGIPGLLWSVLRQGKHQLFFLDFTGETKPYLLSEVNQNMGSLLRMEYKPSTVYYLEDEQHPSTRWKTNLPFPVQTIHKTQLLDQITGFRTSITYTYHHGYWDGYEREFRGFGRVDKRDTDGIQEMNSKGLFEDLSFVPHQFTQYSPPKLFRTWFNLGPVGNSATQWFVPDLSHEFWELDAQVIPKNLDLENLLISLPQSIKRDAYRSMRGQIIRTENYALDSSSLQNRPYTITESSWGTRIEFSPDQIGSDLRNYYLPASGFSFFTFDHIGRTTNWERGNDPMTNIRIVHDIDPYGQPKSSVNISIPRNRNFMDTLTVSPPEPYSILFGTTTYNQPKDTFHQYIVDRKTKNRSYEIINDGKPNIFDLANDIFQANIPSSAYKTISMDLTWYDNDPSKPDQGAFEGLPLGQIGQFGVPVKEAVLMLTNKVLDEVYNLPNGDRTPIYFQKNNAQNPSPPNSLNMSALYPQEFIDSLLPLAGYIYLNDPNVEEGYYTITQSVKFDFHNDPLTAVGNMLENKDAQNEITHYHYDTYNLLADEVINPLGQIIKTNFDYLNFEPLKVWDENQNETETVYNAFGKPIKIYQKGKIGENKGDDPLNPSTQFHYDLWAFYNLSQPNTEKTIRRVHHANDPNDTGETIQSIKYFDGFNRVLQLRAEQDRLLFKDNNLPIDQTQANAPIQGQDNPLPHAPNVLVNSFQLLDNKGNVLEDYEPFYSDGWDYEPPTNLASQGKTTNFYNAKGNIVKVIKPNGSLLQTVYGIPRNLNTPDDFDPSPWETYVYDPNDLASISHPGNSLVPVDHHFSPQSTILNTLGKTKKIISRLQTPQGLKELEINFEYDIRGNQTKVIDALGRVTAQYWYDLKPNESNSLRTDHIDLGTKTMVIDGIGNVIEVIDQIGGLTLANFDAIGRQLNGWARDKRGETTTKRLHIIYGEFSGLSNPENDNLIGQAYEVYHTAGRNRFTAYDFKGNIVSKELEVLNDDLFINALSSQTPATFVMDWQEKPKLIAPDVLDKKVYKHQYHYDALNRTYKINAPENLNGDQPLIENIFNRGGELKSKSFDGKQIINQMAYTPSRKLSFIAYGNNIMTRMTYNNVGWIQRIRSEGYIQNGTTYNPKSGTTRQDLGYQFDLVGNIVKIKERDPNCGIPNSTLGSNALDRLYTYDSLYRLQSATGRESDYSLSNIPWEDAPKGNDPNLTRAYQRSYSYDDLGNLESLRHQVLSSNTTNNFTKTYKYGATTSQGTPKNHLTSYEFGTNNMNTFSLKYDENGSLINEAGNRYFEWNNDGYLRAFYIQAGSGPSSVYAHYLYDNMGNRVKKIVKKGNRLEVEVYVGGIMTHRYVKDVQQIVAENVEYNIGVDGMTFARFRDGLPIENQLNNSQATPTPNLKYYLYDHLKNAVAVLAPNGAWISRESFYPFGESSFGSYAKKRYRFNNKEIDEESGLYYYGLRYYAAYLGRFISVDPLYRKYPEYTPYQYAGNQPTIATDLDGAEPEKTFDYFYTNLIEVEIRHTKVRGPDGQWEYQDNRNTIYNQLFTSIEFNKMEVDYIREIHTYEGKSEVETFHHKYKQDVIPGTVEKKVPVKKLTPQERIDAQFDAEGLVWQKYLYKATMAIGTNNPAAKIGAAIANVDINFTSDKTMKEGLTGYQRVSMFADGAVSLFTAGTASYANIAYGTVASPLIDEGIKTAAQNGYISESSSKTLLFSKSVIEITSPMVNKLNNAQVNGKVLKDAAGNIIEDNRIQMKEVVEGFSEGLEKYTSIYSEDGIQKEGAAWNNRALKIHGLFK